MLWVLCTLLRLRPNKVYVSTDPPVVVPFIVMVYCKIFRADYIYHLQDIHPEAADVVVPVQRWIFKLLRWADVLVMKNATQLITITEQMAEYIRMRSSTRVPIHVLENPAVSFESIELKKTKLPGFSFCGNAGRLQRIPLLMDAIEKYLSSGGSLKFAFAGGGVYSGQLRALSERYANVDYHGLVSARDAAQINVDYEWAILPIADEVTQFAFPSKSSSYVFSGAKILAISGRETSVSRWVLDNNLGVAVPPDIDAVVSAFQEVERSNYASLNIDMERVRLKKHCTLTLSFLGLALLFWGVVMGLESRVVLTGANGFVGRHLADTLMCRGFDFLALSRVSCTADYPSLTIESLGNVDAMKAALSGYSVVIHTAARAHVMQDSVSDPIAEYRRVNTQITLDLAKAAVAAGVRRFIFISSIKVHGEATALGSPYRASDTLMPDDPYGMSKLEAEQGLMKLAGRPGWKLSSSVLPWFMALASRVTSPL